jgi:hypothetical protein
MDAAIAERDSKKWWQGNRRTSALVLENMLEWQGEDSQNIHWGGTFRFVRLGPPATLT